MFRIWYKRPARLGSNVNCSQWNYLTLSAAKAEATKLAKRGYEILKIESREEANALRGT